MQLLTGADNELRSLGDVMFIESQPVFLATDAGAQRRRISHCHAPASGAKTTAKLLQGAGTNTSLGIHPENGETGARLGPGPGYGRTHAHRDETEIGRQV